MYQPEISYPSSITNALKAVVTTTEDHDYVVGQTVKFITYSSNLMTQINGLIGKILEITNDTFTVNIDTRAFNQFVASDPSDFDQASIIPIGDVNFGYVYEGGDLLNRVKGSFVNL